MRLRPRVSCFNQRLRAGCAGRAAPRRWALVVFTLTACALACGGSGALANPGPMGIVFTYVHAGGGDFCGVLPVSTCQQIVQVTDATGVLDFDMILPCWWIGEWVCDATSIVFTVKWPAAWQFVDASVCGSGASVVQVDNSATFSIGNLDGAPASGSLIGLGRLVLNATSEGSTWFSQLYCPSIDLDWVGGRISGCGNCMRARCDDWEPTRPALPSPVLELAADDSGMASGQFHVDSAGSEGYHLAYTFTTTAPWITLTPVSVGQSYYPEYDVTVTANAQALEPGAHEAWVEVHARWCYECEKVVFIVPNPPAAIPETWGSLKTKFR